MNARPCCSRGAVRLAVGTVVCWLWCFGAWALSGLGQEVTTSGQPGTSAPAVAGPSAPPKPAEAKPAEAKPQEPKAVEAKPVEGKPPEARPAEPKPAESKAAEPKALESKPTEPKPAEAKPPESRPAEAKPPEPRPPEPKQAEAKPAEAKPAESKPPEAKAPEAKPGEAKPAESKPPEPKPTKPEPAEPKPSEPAKPSFSYTQLARPMVADRLKLSEEQRAKIAALLAERAELLAKTPEADHPKVVQENEKKLAAVLTEAQRAELERIPPEPLLKFRFRFQRWVDVLDEVARQAGLSLVLDAPPPGTLNYSDDKEYTPTEAIDLLNSVLITKGYTLIRRDRMLVCVNIEEGIPENLVPRVTLEELDYRGKFEMVTVLFALEGRPAATVSQEIKPLLSPHGKMIPLPATGQLLVTDVAGNMRAIRTVIKTIPVPPPTQVPPKPPTPESPIYAMYPLKGVDTKAVLTVMTTLYASDKFVLDPKTDQLHVYAGPSVQKAVKAILEEMMKTGLPPEKQSRLELYPVDEARASQILKNLEDVAPNAKLSFDAKTGKLVAWATGADHELLKGALEKLGVGPVPEHARQFEVYRLTKADPKTTMTVLESLFPQARLAVDASANSLVVIATAADQKAIRALLEQLQPEKPGPDTPELRFYQLTHTPDSGLVKVLEGLAPKAKVTTDVANKRLMVVAPAFEHAVVQRAIEQFEKGTPPEERPKLVAYPVTQAQRKRFQAILSTLTNELPGMQVISEAEPGELAIWAKPEQHKLIGQILDELKREVPGAEKYVLAAYPITVADPNTVTNLLKTMFPTLQAVLDPKTNRLMVWAMPAEQESLKKALDQLQSAVPAESQPRFETYLLHGADPSTLVSNLQTLVPNAKVTVDAKAGKLVVWGTPPEHALIKQAMERLGRGTTLETTPQVETYRLSRADPTTLVPLLQTLVPDAKVTVDSQSKTLIAVAVPADQQTIRSLVSQIQQEAKTPGGPELRVYSITAADPNGTLATLKNLFPNAPLVLDPKTNRLSAWVSAAEHEAIRAALDQLQAPVQPEQQTRFEVYPVHGSDPATLVSQLQTMVPNAKLVADAKASRIVAFGTGPEHQILRSALEKLLRGGSAEATARLEVYRLTKADPATVGTLLQTLVPDAKISVDATNKVLIAVAVPADHLTIKTVLEQLQPEKPPPDAPQLRFYPLAQPAPASLVTVLQGLVPKAQITLEPVGKRLTVVATPADHTILKAAIEQIQTVSVLDEKNKLVTYSVTPGQKKRFQSVASALSAELPGIHVVAEGEPDELAIWAKPSQHAVIGEILEQLKPELPAVEKYRLVAYPIKAADPQNVLTVMKALFPNAQFVLDTRTRRLIVWTLPAEQDAIREALEKVDAGRSGDTEDKLMVYPVPDIDPATAIKVLQEQLPDVKFSTDPKANTILAWGRAADHEMIANTLRQMQTGVEGQLKPTLVAYPLSHGDAAGLVKVLSALVPKAQVTAEPKTNSIVATAVPKDHELIRAAVEQFSKQGPAGTTPEMAVYSVPSLGPSGAAAIIPALRQIFPDATFAVGADPSRLAVWARPGEQPAIKKAVEELAKKEPPETAHKLVIYPVEKAGPGGGRGMLTVLRAVFPDATFGFASDATRIFAWARPADHPAIKNMIEEMTKKEPPETAHKLAVFTLDSHGPAGAAGILPVLRTMFPEVLFATGSEPDKLVAWVRPAEQQEIQKAIEALASPEPPEKARRMVVYTLETVGPAGVSGVISILSTMFPEARFTPGTEPDKLVAYARPAEHEKIKAAVAELSAKESPEKARKIVVYPFKSASPTAAYYTLQTLRTMFPEAQFSMGAEPDRVIVFARPADHKQIQSAIEQMSEEGPPEKAHKMVVYTLESRGGAGISGAINILTTMFPDAKFSAGTEPDQVIAWARPDDHKRIAAAVAEISKKEPPEKARKVVVYPFKSANATASYYTLTVLRTMFPDAQFSIGAEPDKLVVWARPAEHETIRSTIEQLSQEDPPERAYRLVAYTLESPGRGGVSGAISMLSSMFPEAKFTAGADPGKLIAWARPADHEKIRAAVEELAKKEPPEKAPVAALYELGAMNASAAIPFLRTAFPEAEFSAGSEPNMLIAWARPADHELIKATIEKIDVEGAPTSRRTVAVYALKAGDAKTLLQLLDPMVRRNVELVADPVRNRLVVWADPKQQESIRKTIEQFQKQSAEVGEPSTQVYQFEWADPQAAQTVLATLVPEAKIAFDSANHRLVVTATPEDHQRIRAAVTEMDRRDAGGQAPRLQVHRVTTADPSHLLTVLRGLFRARSDVQLSLDEQNDAIVAVASPAQHETIRNLIEQLEKESKADSAVRLQLYPLKDADPQATLRVLTELLEKQGVKARLSHDPRTNQLVAIARPEQHATIQKTLEQMQGEERILEIFALEVVDPWTAEMAIGRLFTDSPYSQPGHAPVVDVDPVSQQLFVRATKEQMAKIRELLVKLGETGLAAGPESEGRRSRTIPFDGDISAALEEIQRVWPQLRPNPIQVLKPAGEIPVQGRRSRSTQEPDRPAVRPAAGPEHSGDRPLPRNEAKPAPTGGWRPGAGKPMASPTPRPAPETGGWRASSQQPPDSQASKPVIVVPGDGVVTIASEDPAALAQFEELLRAMSRQRGAVGRNFSVFLLHNAKAANVAETLQRLFRSTGAFWRAGAGPVTLVPDERLNAIVAYAGRSDRATLENLIKILDTAEVPESLTAERLHLIPVKNTSAHRMELILQSLFGNQAGGFSVEETTNSVVLWGSKQLADEMTRVVETLDAAAGSESSRGVTIVPLRKASSERVQKALDIILKSSPSRRRR